MGRSYTGVCCRVRSQWGWRLMSTISWRRFRRFAESDRGVFDEEVLRGWIRGEDVEAFSKDPFETVESRIISSGKGKVMGGEEPGVVL